MVSAHSDPSVQEHGAVTSAPIPYHPKAEGTQDDDEGDLKTLTTNESIAEAIGNYRKIHGRTFGNSQTTDYWAPNDEQQNEGLDLTHHFLLLYFDNKLFHAPIGDAPKRVLDVGTGTGIWAIDFADQFPIAEVTGTDISPIQPGWAPPNCTFEMDDCQLDWTWPRDHFDYIHLRDLYGSIGDWPALHISAFAHLAPGGWFEHQELDIRCHSDVVSADPDHIYNRWNAIFQDAGEKLGKTFKVGIGSRVRDLAAEAGFVDVVQKRVRIPIGPWSSDPKLREVGEYTYHFVNGGVEGFALFLLTQVMGWQYEDCQVLISQMMDAINKYKEFRPYYELTYVYGRKPDA